MKITAITEIQAYALGAYYLYPEVRTVLDIGGQDTKVIALTGTGKVAKLYLFIRSVKMPCGDVQL